MNTLFVVLAMAFAALLGSVGQLAMKKAASMPLLQAFGWLFLFAASYGVGVIINYLVYRSGAKISLAYPVIALSYVFSAVLAWYYLGEQVTATGVVGIGFIVLGVALVGFGAN